MYMQDFVIIEVGSTNTKAYLCKANEVLDLGFKTIEFKNHYKKENKINLMIKRYYLIL